MKEIKRLTRCERGHFYDAGKFDVCPHCENTMEITPTAYEPEIPDPRNAKPTAAPAGGGFAPREDIQNAVTRFTPSPSFVGGDNSAFRPQEDSMTVQFYQKTLGSEPVVGWLVCINGVHHGQDFRIKSGRNFVGRSGSMDVCLSGDIAVSRDRHLIVTYDPKTDSFFAQPGDSSSVLSYLNDKPLLEAAVLKAGDKLTLGETDLMFVPFCGKLFKWN